MAPDKKEYLRTQLVKKAQEKGAVTYDDILALMPDAERDIALLDDLMESLSDQGVDVVDHMPMEGGNLEGLPPDLALGEDDEEFFGLEFDNDLVDDAGYQQALDTDDVVGLYLKEAGRVPLLTAEEEVSLAKRMEAAIVAQQQVDEYGDDLSITATIFQWMTPWRCVKS